jgi:endo-1,4-beta-xylanase
MSDLDHRVIDATVLVTSADGRPIADAPVTIEQVDHAFGFGNIGFDFVEWVGGPPRHEGGRAIEFFGGVLPDGPDRLAADWLELFNLATLPFYWRGYEPVPGAPELDRLTATAQWFAARGVEVKGHPLLWHTLTPHWLLDLDETEAEAVIRDHIGSVVADFTGVISLWDAINEAVIMPVFTAETNAVTRLAQKLGRVGMVSMAFELAREANPNARFVLNDFDLSERYEHLIEECLEAGVRIDALGLQTHMHQGYRGAERILETIERFARFGLPIQLTETTLLSGDLMPPHIDDLNDYIVDSWPTTPEGEARQADEIVQHYRSVVSHPAVESLTYWGFGDQGAWLGAPSGLVRLDGTRKPAFDALHGLIKGEWWMPPTDSIATAQGAIAVRGFAGTYRVTTAQGSAEFTLAPGAVTVPVVISGTDPS